MDLAETLTTNVRTLLAVIWGGYWLALGAIFGSALAGAIFTMTLAATRVPTRAPRRGVRSNWR